MLQELEIEKDFYEVLFDGFQNEYLWDQEEMDKRLIAKGIYHYSVFEGIDSENFLMMLNFQLPKENIQQVMGEDSAIRKDAIASLGNSLKKMYHQALMTASRCEDAEESPEEESRFHYRNSIDFFAENSECNFDSVSELYIDSICGTGYSKATEDAVCDALKPASFMKMCFYYRYHKIYDEEIYAAFAKMLAFPDSKNIDTFYTLTIQKEPDQAKKLIASAIDHIKKKKEKEALFNEIYRNAKDASTIYTSIEYFIPSIAVIDQELRAIVADEVYNPTVIKDFDYLVLDYRDRIKDRVKRQLISNITDKTETEEGRAINDKQLRYCLRIFTDSLGFGNQKLSECPKNLRHRLNEYADYYHANRKEMYWNGIILLKREYIQKFGELFVLVLLLYAFSPDNYNNPSNIEHKDAFHQLVQESIAQEQTHDLLKTYLALMEEVIDPNYKSLVEEILK